MPERPDDLGGDVPLPPERPDDLGEAGSCWSPTLDEQVDAMTCVKSKSNGIWFQCKDGKWYAGVMGTVGPFAPCKGRLRDEGATGTIDI